MYLESQYINTQDIFLIYLLTLSQNKEKPYFFKSDIIKQLVEYVKYIL